MTEARVPTRATLRKYGLTLGAWCEILSRQHGGCGVCGKVPPSGTLHIEHEHVRGFWKLPFDQRAHSVRGLACWFCNGTLLRRGVTPEKLRAAADYLERYAKERASAIQG